MNLASVRSPPGLLGAACAVLGLLAGCGRPQPDSARPVGAPVREVRTAPAVTRPMERTVDATGFLLPHEAATLSVKVAGRLLNLAVDLGSAVKPGDLIAQVEPRDYELREQQAGAALAQARAALGLPHEGTDDHIPPEQTSPVLQAKAVLDEAAKNRERVLRLAEQGISSTAEQDTVEAAFKVARSRYESALDEARTRQAALAQRRAELELARKQLADTAVRAPFAGVVQERLANLGEFLPSGSPVVRLVQISPLRLRLEIPERKTADVVAGQTVRFTVEGSPESHETKLARLSPALTDQSRVMVVEADVNNPGTFRVGAFARAQIVVAEERGVAVPAEALVVFAGLEKVVSVRDGKARERPVTTGRRGPGWIEIVTGLDAGEAVVLDPGNLQTGQAVRVVSPAPAAAGTASS